MESLRGISAQQLVEYIRSDNGELGSLHANKEEIRDERLVNEVLNYNQNLISGIESQLLEPSWDYTQSDKYINYLYAKDLGYLIDKNLECFILEGFNTERPKIFKTEYFYLVVFNTIKKDGKLVLVYNYIAYNKLFFRLFFVYAALEQKHCLLWTKKGYIASDYFFILDNKLRVEYPWCSTAENLLNKFYPELYTDERFVDRYGCSVSRFITLLKWCSRGMVKDINFSELGDLQLINHMLSKEHIRLVQYLSASRELEEIKET